MRSCYMSVSCLGACLGCSYHYLGSCPTQTDSAGSTVLGRLPASGGCPRHIQTRCLRAEHTATLALLGT